MLYQIANQYLQIDPLNGLTDSLSALSPYASSDAPDDAIRLTLFRFVFPKHKIPDHDKDYSGFLERAGSTPGKDPFVFCFREGQLLFGLQKETDGAYSAYVHAQTSISCKTAAQYTLLLEGCARHVLGMHTVTLAHDGRTILFSAPSGTGKTTHTELWRKEFGATIVNGDYAFLECRNDGVDFLGTPFCGSSPYAEKCVRRVDDIVFLKQAPANHAARIGKMSAAANAMENCFIPTWDAESTKLCMDLIGKLLKNTRVWQLECNMDPEAAHVMKNAIFAP